MKLLFVLFLSISLWGETKKEMFNLYQNKKFEEVCNIGLDAFEENKKDEEFLSLYSFACLKSDYIDRLTIPTAMLKFSKEARFNAAYFSVIMMQKKLLYHAMIDGYDISKYNFPTTDYILSKVFDFYTKLGKHQKREFYIFEDANDTKLTYKLYLISDYKITKIVIEEFYDTIILNQHLYW